MPVTGHSRVEGSGGVAFPLDASLDTPGTPASGTGQISLLTGRNAAHLFGRHFGPWPPVRLRPLLAQENLLVQARERGKATIFANAYPRGYLERAPSRTVAAPPVAAHAAGLLHRHGEALSQGTAVASEIVNSGWRRRLGRSDLPEVTPREAGGNLSRLANQGELTLFAHYATDLAGHRGGREGAVAALERVDDFLAGVLEELDPGHLLMLGSDHGNIEELGTGHTRNPALGLCVGPGGLALSRSITSITQVAPALLRILG